MIRQHNIIEEAALIDYGKQKKLKIAVCFFGITRSLTHTIGSIEKNILGPARELGEVRVFAHFFRQLAIDNPRSRESGLLAQDEHVLLNADLLELEEPGLCLSAHDFDVIKTYGDRWKDEFRSLKNLVHQLHSLNRVTNVALDWDADIYIFARPDLMYHDSFKRVLRKVARSRLRTAYIPTWQRWHGGLNDRFGVCVGADAAQAYGTRLTCALQFAETDTMRFNGTDRGLHGERLLGHVLRSAGIRVKGLGVRASRIRNGGFMYQENFQDTRPTAQLYKRIRSKASRFFT